VKLGRLLFFVVLVAGCAQSTAPGDMAMPKKDICPDNPQLCPGTCCGAICVNTLVDGNNCGTCGKSCDTGTVCSDGHCGCLPTGVACGMGQSCCGNAGCKSLASDINNCGACGKACGPGATCVDSQCVCGAAPCAMGEVCCGGTCAPSCASAPDMSMSTCVCPSGCPLSHVCVGPSCCLEDYLINKSCMPDPSCMQS
jgi:hypothetical protein